MREFAEQFYKSKTWIKCRNAYSKSVGHLCEECMRQGISTPGDIVHHKVHIEPWNITNPEVTLDWSNLELLCRNCHGKAHDRKAHRFEVDECGRVMSLGR